MVWSIPYLTPPPLYYAKSTKNPGFVLWKNCVIPQSPESCIWRSAWGNPLVGCRHPSEGSHLSSDHITRLFNSFLTHFVKGKGRKHGTAIHVGTVGEERKWSLTVIWPKTLYWSENIPGIAGLMIIAHFGNDLLTVRLIISDLTENIILKGSVSRQVRHRLLYIIRKLFIKPLLPIFIEGIRCNLR